MGERPPRGYRLAYENLWKRERVCYPIGIHLIAMAIHRIWELTFWWSPSRLERLIWDADQKGYERARKQFEEERMREVETCESLRKLLGLKVAGDG